MMMFTEWHTEQSWNSHLLRIYQSHHSDLLWGRSSSRRPYQMPNQQMPKSAYTIYKVAFQEQKRAPIRLSVTTNCEDYMFDMDQWHTTHAWSKWHNPSPSNGHLWVTSDMMALKMPGTKAYIIAQNSQHGTAAMRSRLSTLWRLIIQ